MASSNSRAGSRALVSKDQVAAQLVQLLEVGSECLGAPFLTAQALPFLMECLRGGSVFSLGHSGTKAFSRSLRKLSIHCGRDCP
jgi:hypothetical protein